MIELYFELDKLYRQQRLLDAEILRKNEQLEKEKLLQQQINILHKKETEIANQDYKKDNYYNTMFDIK